MTSDPTSNPSSGVLVPQANEVPGVDLEIAQVLRDLETPFDVLAVDAIRAAQRLGPAIVPALIDLLRNACRGIREGIKQETNGPFFAFVLLVEFQAKEAWPVILEVVSLPDGGADDLVGDAVHEVLPYAVVTLASERLEDVVSAIRNFEINEFVRWSLIRGLTLCVAAGVQPRDKIVQLLREFLRESLAAGTSNNVLGLVFELYALHPAEAHEEIKEAFDQGFIGPRDISPDEITERIELGEEATMAELAKAYAPITDTVEFLQSWAVFQPRGTSEPRSEPWSELRSEPIRAPIAAPPEPPPAKSEGFRHSEPRVGRNDPCPCGSGKKFKKCCAKSNR